MLILEIGFAIASIVIIGITIFAVVCMLRDWIMAETVFMIFGAVAISGVATFAFISLFIWNMLEIAFTIFGTTSITLVAIFAFVPLIKDCKKK